MDTDQWCKCCGGLVGQINDEVLRATGGPSLNDGLATWFGRTATETIGDAERRWLLAQAGAAGGTLGDLWYAVLRAAGHTGSLNDMKLSYWSAQDTFVLFLFSDTGDFLTDDLGNFLIR